jgi:uncharacterized membrane protein
LTIGCVSALVLTKTTFGGDFAVRSSTVLLAIVTIGATVMAYYNIKMLQIDQHRKWILRSMFYMGSVITQRIVLFASFILVASSGEYSNVPLPSFSLDFVFRNQG